jgi:Ras family protein A
VYVSVFQVAVSVWDTAGQEDYDRLRPFSYPDSHVVFICFAVDRPDSLDNVATKWAAEVRHYCFKVPVILVGNKKDLRHDPDTIRNLARANQKPVTTEQGHAMAAKIQAHAYVECSAMTQEGVREAFETAVRATLKMKKSKRSRHRLL